MQIDIEEIKNKLYTRLKESGWGDKLKTFMLSEDFDKIIINLIKEVEKGKRFTPPIKQMFNAFEKCNYKDLKVIMMVQDPYSYIGIADGMAFSCSNEMKPQAPLKYILKAVQTTVYDNQPYEYNPDLTRWANQGILLLNTSLTVEIGKSTGHTHIWNPFMMFLVDILNAYNPGLIYLFIGKYAQQWMEHVSDNNHKLTCSHPHTAVYMNQEHWDCDDVFNKISKLVKDHYNYDIIW